MHAYTTLGSNDLPRATKFYDAILGDLGAKQVMSFDRMVLWGKGKSAMFGVCKPYDGKTATSGNGTMITLAVDSRANVDAIYKKAISLGAKDEGAPGERGPGFYLAYFRDLDGNKLALFSS